MDYLYYILAVLIIGLLSICCVRIATRSKNPDLVMQYEARKSAARKLAKEKYGAKAALQDQNQSVTEIKSLRQRHREKIHHQTPWGWPGAQPQHAQQQGISDTVRNFTDRLLREKQVVQNANASNSIRALLEDRYGPINRGMSEIPYEKVKRPLLRDPSEPFDQLDNLGNVESRHLRKKLQFLTLMNIDESDEGKATDAKKSKKVEFRYVDLKDLKQPWGW